MKKQFSILAVGLTILLIGSSVPQKPINYSSNNNRMTSVEQAPAKAKTVDAILTSDGIWGDSLKSAVILRGA